ncbi:hypothetical protein ACFSC3_13960 [Sphingomonas floccifaciens]|uniref:Secreted protein n=1 Tax=Sphingomonas floccifaciens TaxID=1844115 RepID=A0ABW4NF18_9SPHN
MRRHLMLLPIALAGCSPQGPTREPADPATNATEAEAAAIANIEDRARIDVLQNRVVALEREVGELKANPQALDLDLLTQRIERLEAGAISAATVPATKSPRATPVDSDAAQRAVDAAIAERRAKRAPRD